MATAFAPLAVLALYPNVLVCTSGFQARSVADVIRLARAKPGSIAYASSGNGSAQHLAGALFENLAKVELLHVPYRGGAPAMNDVMGGQVPLFFGNVASLRPHRTTRPRSVKFPSLGSNMTNSRTKIIDGLEWSYDAASAAPFRSHSDPIPIP